MTRSSRTAVWLALVGLAAATLMGTQLGAAAALEVRVAAPLQVIEMDVDVDLPDPAPTEHTIAVIVRRFSGGNSPHEVGNSPVELDFSVPAGHDYTISWSEGPTVACSEFGYSIPVDHVETIDEDFTASADATHEVCTQSGHGTISWTATAPVGGG